MEDSFTQKEGANVFLTYSLKLLSTMASLRFIYNHYDKLLDASI